MAVYTTIDDPSAYFQTVLWTGNGSSQSITFGGNSDMQPDWLWTKCRSDNFDPIMRDTSRGISNRLLVHATDAEGGATGTTAFNSDGFSLDSTNTVNNNTDTYVAWGWKANGGTRTTNTESGDNPAGGYQANTTAGFSIVDWTGTGGAGGLMAHGLGAVPHVIITKTRSHANAWAVYHHKNTSAPETDYLVLSSDAATVDNVNRWNDTVPTSTNLVLGDVGGVNGNDQTQIAYVFTEIQGYSKFGSYTGNGNANGAFVYLGFKPRLVIIKNTGRASTDWIMCPGTIDRSNPVNDLLEANSNAAVNTAIVDVDFYSNGFKIRGSGNPTNTSADSYIYMAFAESPFVSSEGVPTTAR